MKKAIFLFLLTGLVLPVFSFAQSQTELQQAIDVKTKELREIHQKIVETQDDLIETGKKKKTLSREISKNTYRVNQLRLTLQSNKINIQKLGLEINSLNYDVQSAQDEIKLKSEAINKILRELQIKDGESLIVTFLKNQSLAESLAEIDNLREIRLALKTDVKTLQTLKTGLNDKLGQVGTKKSSVEREYNTSKVRKSLVEEQTIERRQLLALTKTQEKSYEQLLDELAEKQAQIAREIEKFEADLRRRINPELIPAKRPGVLSWPVKKGYKSVTQNYGATKFARYGYKGQWHNGIDIGSPLGTPILAAGDGLVFSTGDQDKYCRGGAYGKFIIVKLNNNLTTLYAHLSRIAVTPGDQIKRGDVIGYMGSTGYSTGSHLHFTVYDSNTFLMKQSRSCGIMPYGGDINPASYL